MHKIAYREKKRHRFIRIILLILKRDHKRINMINDDLNDIFQNSDFNLLEVLIEYKYDLSKNFIPF